MQTFLKTIIVMMSIAMVVTVGVMFGLPMHTSAAESEISYTLPYPLEKIKKALIKGDVLQEVVDMNNGRVLKNDIKYVNASSEKLLSGWEVDACIEFTIAIPNPYIGELTLDMVQYAKMNKDMLQGNVALRRPHKGIQAISSEIVFKANGEQTDVNFKSRLVVSRRIPFFLRNYLDKEVKLGTEKVCYNSKTAIRTVVDRGMDRMGQKKKFNLKVPEKLIKKGQQ